MNGESLNVKVRNMHVYFGFPQSRVCVTYSIEVIERNDFKEERIFQYIVITTARMATNAKLSLNNVFAISGEINTHFYIR